MWGRFWFKPDPAEEALAAQSGTFSAAENWLFRTLHRYPQKIAGTRGVPAEICGDTYIKKSNIKSIYTPPPALWDRCQKFCDGDQDLEAALLGLLESRAVRKNPLVTDRALSILLNKLARLSKGDHAVMIALLDKSVLKNWDSVYELKPDELPASSSGQAPTREAGDVDGI